MLGLPCGRRRVGRRIAVAEADAAGVVVCRQTGGSSADGVETRDPTTRAVERSAVGVGDQATERECRVNGAMVDAQVDGADAAGRRHADRLQEGRAFVEGRVVTAGRGLVVLAHRARQSFGGNARGRRRVPRGWPRRSPREVQ